MVSDKRLVLIVDDSQINRQILCKILSDTYDTLQAANGKEALQILRQQPEAISAVLLDLIMPVMNGYEFLDIQQTDKELAAVPVIVETQREGTDSEIDALARGASDFLTKPYNPALVRQRLANIIKLHETSAFVNMVERDALTHLYTKEAFYMRAKEMLSQNPDNEYDILCMDIKNFKLVNDVFGESKGDWLLCFLAKLLKDCIPNGCVCRHGGDIFAAILPRQATYSPIISKMKAVLKEQPIHMNLQLKFGIYPVDDRSITVRAMCDRAKIACKSITQMYGTNLAFYSKAIGDRLSEEQQITAEMNQALLNGEFVVYYQPKYDLETEKLIGAESLVRWKHPKRGFLPPDTFVPLFEQNGFITQLDIFVWKTVCGQMREWLDSGLPCVPVAINLSRVDIYNPQLPEIIIDILNQQQLKPEYIQLEITETAYMDNPKQLIATVDRLKQYGFQIDMDDFGSGYSSLNMLNEVPVDTLKLDMRFLRDAQTTSRGGNILFFIMNLAKWLEVTVVAEGIETREQMLYLRGLGCNYGQGYYFAKPMPSDDYQHLLSIQTANKNKLAVSILSCEKANLIPQEEIWKMDSTFNRVFNGFIGALALFEYQNGKLLLIRPNDAFMQKCSFINGYVGASLTTIFCVSDAEKFQKILQDGMQNGEPFSQVFYSIPNKEYAVRMRMQLICQSTHKTLVMASADFVSNVSELNSTTA